MKMTRKKTAFFLIILLSGIINSAHAEIQKEISIETYSVEFENFQWYKRIFIALKGYDFLDWKEMNITTAKEYDTETGKRTIVGVSIIHDGNKKFFEIEKGDEKYSGLVDVDGPDEFTEPMVRIFLNIWNYFYDQRKENLEITEEKIVKDNEDDSTFRCSLQKEIRDGKTVISTVPPDGKKKFSRIEATMENPENPVLAQIKFRLKGGEGITLTLKPPVN